MQEETRVKTHLIITDIHDEFNMNWCGTLFGSSPLFDKDGIPIFTIIGSKNRTEVHTLDMQYLETCAKHLTCPKGRAAVTSDTVQVYLKEDNGSERLLGVLTHKKVKSFAPMYDKVKIKQRFL